MLFLYHVSRHIFGLTNSGARSVHRQLLNQLFVSAFSGNKERRCARHRAGTQNPERRASRKRRDDVDVLAEFSLPEQRALLRTVLSELHRQ